jgi:KDO2-lipid IV(A) lauroyltransferase
VSRRVINPYNIFKYGSKIAPLLPVWLGNALCDLAGLVIFWFVPSKRKAVLCNLAHAIPERSEKERRRIARTICKNSMRNYYDLMRVHAVNPAKRAAQVELKDSHYVYEAFKGKGIIAIAAHQGSFSFVSQIATYVKFDFYLTLEPIKPPKLFELVRELREQDPRTHTIAVGGSEVRAIFRALKEDAVVCMAIDRDVTGSGQSLKFFGEETKLPTGVAEIALKTGASVMPIRPYRRPNGEHGIQFYPAFTVEPTGDKAADIARAQDRMLREIEKLIRTAPDDWVFLQPIWPDCP